MEKLLNEISEIPGVIGSCIFDKNQGMLCRKFDVNLPRDLTDNIGMNFIRLLQMAAMNKLDIKSAQFRFDRYWLIGIPLQKGIILLAICDLHANCSLVAATAVMLMADMLNELDEPFDRPQEGASQESVSVRKQKGLPNDNEDIQLYFAEIENALAAAIGPVARMVMSDYVYKWIQDAPPSVSRLPELLNILAEEIEDPTLIAEFKSQLKHLF
jgi:hypothetical protein